MLAKAFHSVKSLALPSTNSGLLNLTKRGVYAAGTEPKVFVNKHTRVICQGITGKHVSSYFKE